MQITLYHVDEDEIDENGTFVVPNNITIIGKGALPYSKKLKELIVLDNVDTIEMDAVLHCLNLESIIIPESTCVRSYAFSGCTNVKHINGYNISSVNYIPESICLLREYKQEIEYKESFIDACLAEIEKKGEVTLYNNSVPTTYNRAEDFINYVNFGDEKQESKKITNILKDTYLERIEILKQNAQKTEGYNNYSLDYKVYLEDLNEMSR